MTNEEAELAQAIEKSLQSKTGGFTAGAAYEPLNPEQRRREDNTPVGLQNVGNSRHFLDI